MNGLLQLWSQWLSGNLPPDTMLWGHKLFFWARIGKLTQFVGAAFIIFDIIGPEKIRKWGSGLHSKIQLQSLVQFYKQSWVAMKLIMKMMTNMGVWRIPGKKVFQEQLRIIMPEYFAVGRAGIITLGVYTGIFFAVLIMGRPPVENTVGIICVFLLALVAPPILTLFLVGLFVGIGFLADIFL